jgi:hypothetical protein
MLIKLLKFLFVKEEYAQYCEEERDLIKIIEGAALKLINFDDHSKKFMSRLCEISVKNNISNLQYVKSEFQSEELFLSALKPCQRPCLQYIVNQTEERNNEDNFKYVKEQTEKICIAAVAYHEENFKYVKEQTEKICIIAVKKMLLLLNLLKIKLQKFVLLL